MFKMEFEDVDYVLNAYCAAVDTFERTECFFHGNKRKDYSTLLKELKNCCSQIDLLITLETDNSAFVVALFQQKQQLNMLINITEKLIQEEIMHKYVNNWVNMELPGQQRSYNFIPPQIPEIKRKKLEENENLMDVIKNTIEIPKVGGLKEIVGLYDVKKVLKSSVILPKTQPQLFQSRRICNSILLFGPPGTGKTRLVHALAAEADATFHCITAGNVLSHYVGQTEKTIKMLFQYLKTSYNFSILFIDEIDGFCRKRSASEQEHTRRIKTELMCQMSSIEDCKNMVVICATNCPWDLDTAILRRFQKRIYVPLPNQLERMEFFRFFTQNIQFEGNLDNWIPLLHKTDGYSGSDLSDVVQSALNIPLNELEDTKIWKCSNDGFYEPVLGEQDFCNVICSELSDLPSNSVKARQVHMTDLLNAVDHVMRTVSPIDVKKYEHFNGI